MSPNAGRLPAQGLSRLAFLIGAAVLFGSPVQAQTTYIGGDQSGGTTTVGDGGGAVIVNMDAIGGTRPADTRGGASSAPNSTAEFGEPIQGPGGALLRYPPKKPPRSHLTVEIPDGMAAPSPDAPQRKPEVAMQTPAPASEAFEAETPQPADKPMKAADVIPPKPPARPQIAAARSATEPAASRKPARKPARAAKTHDKTTGDANGVADDASVRPPTPPDSATKARQTAEAAVNAAPSGSDRARAKESPENEAPPAPEGVTENGHSDAVDTQADKAGQTQTASLPPADEGFPEQVRLTFAEGAADLSDDARATLSALAERLMERPRQRIQLVAYAAAANDQESRARRLSLSRALAVRSYLIDKGVRSTRMDVRALGSTADDGPLNRLDIRPARR